MLPDYLKPGLDLVFVGFNPSLKSAEIGHYYAGPGNQFWPFLYEAGFVNRLLRPEEDKELLGFGIGVTDMVKRATRGIGELRSSEYSDGLRAVATKLAQYSPGTICFNGKTGYCRALNRTCDYGLQDEEFCGAQLFLAPSTSGALPMHRTEKLQYYIDLKTAVTFGKRRGK